MRNILALVAASAAFATPVQAQPNLEKGFAGALRGCEEWVLNPASWADGIGPFVKAVGLGDQMGLVENVEEVNLPPQHLRGANHYWRINSTQDAGYILVVSDRLPMCHITGGGGTDLQPIVEGVLLSPEFQRRWEQLQSNSSDDMVSTIFRNRQEPKLSIAISRARLPGQRLDRVQLLATATYQTTD
ncbi:MAG TPA: hypothetical protein VFO12_09550 [Sphingomicrobium sp.]|nr:hypothetical protein [Sphingomicrobium sp.]